MSFCGPVSSSAKFYAKHYSCDKNVQIIYRTYDIFKGPYLNGPFLRAHTYLAEEVYYNVNEVQKHGEMILYPYLLSTDFHSLSSKAQGG